MQESDPHPSPTRFIGKRCSFEHESRSLAGVIIAQEYIGRTPRGAIPDYRVTIRGQSGKTLTVSLVESRTSIHD